MKEGKRYFIVSFAHGFGFGRNAVVTDGGMYINDEKFRIATSKGIGKRKDDICIIAISEISETDFEQFTKIDHTETNTTNHENKD